MPIKKIKVEEGDKTQDVIIAMTPEEAQDRSYVDYLEEGATARSKDQLRKKKPMEKSRLSDKEKAEAIKDYNARREAASRRSVRTRYYSADYTS